MLYTLETLIVDSLLIVLGSLSLIVKTSSRFRPGFQSPGTLVSRLSFLRSASSISECLPGDTRGRATRTGSSCCTWIGFEDSLATSCAGVWL